MKRLLYLVLIIAFLLQGCATYNYKKDPTYQAYLRGEITYAEYLDHYHKLMAERRARVNAISDACGRLAEANRRANVGEVYPQYPSSSTPTRVGGETVIRDNRGRKIGTVSEEGGIIYPKEGDIWHAR